MAKANGVAVRPSPTEVGPVSNAAAEDIAASAPYTATVRIVGTADLLMHRWNCEAVAEKDVA